MFETSGVISKVPTTKENCTRQPLAHESAHLHTSGEATYIDDLPEVIGTLNAALGLSSKAHAEIVSIDLKPVIAAKGVVAVFDASNIPATNDCGPIVHDDPVLATDKVHYLGQPIFVVVAITREQARKAAKLAKIEYKPLPAVLDPLEAHAKGEYVTDPVVIEQLEVNSSIERSSNKHSGSFSVGGQEQFYLEGQVAYAQPEEDGTLKVYSSTQHPTEMQQVIAHALGLPIHKITVEVRRMGGGFGGKESQSALFAVVASMCAFNLQCPVKLRPDRDDDMLITGKRHDFYYNYEAGFSNSGELNAVAIEMVARGGFSADLSYPVITRAVCHIDNAYYLPKVKVAAWAAKTNTQSNTAFRGFGGPQGAIAIEYLLDDIAHTLGLDPLEVRKKNLYGTDTRNLTPYGQTIRDNVILTLIEELEHSSNYHQRRKEIQAFNAANKVIKKGIALTPVKFGISFNLQHFNQAGALVHVYLDGTVLVNHGGTEMGQGLHTKIAQVVANLLGLTIDRVRATATNTSKVANTSATAASTGTDLNGKAAQNAANNIRLRLSQYAAKEYGGAPKDVEFANNLVIVNGHTLAFEELCQGAYLARVQLWSDGFYATPDIFWDRLKVRGNPFYYFAYGAAVSEVAIDTLTGESKLLAVDILHDAGDSINPAIDLGQIEGAFIQGAGWLTCEQLNWDANGKLATHAPSTYKIPAVNDCPPKFTSALFANSNKSDTVMRSKAVGEPPLLLAFSVFFAIRDAIASLKPNTPPPLQSPATPEAILQAISALKDGKTDVAR